MILIFRRLSPIPALLALAVATSAAAQQPDDLARRIAATASIAVDEYTLGVVDGAVVLPAEYEEARLFLTEARRTAGELPPVARDSAVAALERLLRGLAGLVAAEDLRDEVGHLRSGLERNLGVTLDQFPDAPPSLAVGAERYRTYCAQCHGETGAGDGAMAAGLEPPPADLTDPALRGTSPLEFFRKINVGVAGTAMSGYEEQLSLQERWSVALYASTLRHAGADRDRGAAWIADRCPGCRVVLSGLAATAPLSDDSLLGLITAEAGTAPRDTLAVVAWARAAAAVEELGAHPGLAARRVARHASEMADEALATARAGNPAAAAREALDGYLVYEGIEATVAARNATASRAVERSFGAYRMALAAGNLAAAEAAHAQVIRSLDDAAAVLDTGSRTTVLFGQSLLIMVREGLEAILIIGALIAFLVRADAEHRVREIGWGAFGAIGASFLTAAAFAWIFRASAAHREALEGITMLIAAAVLFSVASWLVSKIEAEKWKAFVGGQMHKAMRSQGKWALAALAFLVVYREGFETVLFYAALYSTAQSAGGVAGVTTGLIIGSVLLVGIYLAIRRYGVKLPLKPIFAVTGILLLVLAFSFAGQGVAELQEAGMMPMTPLAWLPSFPFLGVFPTLQTLAAQLVVAAAFLAAVAWFYWLQPKAVPVRR